LNAGTVFAAVQVVDAGQADGINLQGTATADVQRVVTDAKRCVLVGIAHNTSATVFTADHPGQTSACVDVTAASAQVCLIVKALQGPILRTEEGPAARFAA